MRSELANWAALAGLPWVLVSLVLAETVFGAFGIPRDTRPPWLSLADVLLAVAPFLLGTFAPVIGKAPGFGWLLERPQPSIRVDSAGVTVGGASRREPTLFDWGTIGAIAVAPRWRSPALLALDGSRLATLSTPFVVGDLGPTLAELLLAARPGDFVPTERSRSGRPIGIVRQDLFSGTPRLRDVGEFRALFRLLIQSLVSLIFVLAMFSILTRLMP